MRDFQLRSGHILVLLLAAGLVFTLMSISKPISDFGNYYYGAEVASDPAVLVSRQVYDVMGFNSEVEKAGEHSFFLNHNSVTPQSVVLYRPFTWIGNAALAKIIFNLLGLALFAFSLGRLFRKHAISVDLNVVLIVVAALIPLYYNILFGQTYLVLAALIIEAFLQADKRPWLSGLFLGIAISLKISPVIFLAWFLVEKKFRVVAWTALCFAVFATWTALMIPTMKLPFIEFYVHALPRIMNGFVTDPYSSSFQGFVVFLRKAFSADEILNPDAIIDGGERMVQFLNTLFFVVMSVLLVGAWKSTADWRKKILLLILFLNITSGYTSTYSLILMVPFIAFGNTVRDWTRVMLYAIILMFPPRLFDGYSPLLEEYKLWLFIAVFLIEIQPSFGFRRLEKTQVAVAALLLIAIVVKFVHRPEQMPLTYYKPHIVNQDYVLAAIPTDSTIEYVSYTPDGFREFDAPFAGKPDDCESCGDFYVQGVKFRRVGMVGDSLLVLSDYHRGPGLFHLYTISRRDLERTAGY